MQNPELTPYDTGARLEPQLWPAVDADTFGRVDFDDDEARTVFTAHVERTATGYVLHLDNLSDPLTVTVDGERICNLNQ